MSAPAPEQVALLLLDRNLFFMRVCFREHLERLLTGVHVFAKTEDHRPASSPLEGADRRAGSGAGRGARGYSRAVANQNSRR